MTTLIVILAILLGLWLIGRIRVGARLSYDAGGFLLWITALGRRFQVVPARKGSGKRDDEKKKRKEPDEEDVAHERGGGSLAVIRQLLPVALDALKYLRRKIRADVLRMELTVSAEDPADAAVRYGQASALLGALWGPVTESLRVVDGRAHVAVDFQAHEPVIMILAQFSLTVGQIVTLAAVYGIRALIALLRARGRDDGTAKRKGDESDGTEASDQ